MDGSVLAVQYIAFVASGLIASVAQASFFKSLRERAPEAITSEDDLLHAVGRSPMRLVPILMVETRRRLSALSRRWPYPDVERSRRRALLSFAVSLAAFGWLLTRPGA